MVTVKPQNLAVRDSPEDRNSADQDAVSLLVSAEEPSSRGQ